MTRTVTIEHFGEHMNSVAVDNVLTFWADVLTFNVNKNTGFRVYTCNNSQTRRNTGFKFYC